MKDEEKKTAALADEALNAVAGGYSPFDRTITCSSAGRLIEDTQPAVNAAAQDDIPIVSRPPTITSGG